MMLVLFAALLALLGACADPQNLGPRPVAEPRDAAPAVDASARAIDFALPPPGVPDPGRTTAVVLVEVGVSVRCTAALVASNVVLAPARCAAGRGCSGLPPSALSVRSSDETRERLGDVVEVVGPPATDFCDDGSLAALILSFPSDGLAPFAVRARPAAAGEFVRFVGVTRSDDARSIERTLRDHLRVEATTRRTARIAGNGCATWPGAILLDEATGELLGVGSASGGTCDEETLPFVQLDSARALIDEAMVRAAAPRPDPYADGGLVSGATPRRGKASRPTLDLGEPCDEAAQCAAGVCVLEAGASAGAGYCSRTCGPGDRCPVGLHCVRADEARSACVRSG
jgi:hypothetical protein